MIIGIGSDLVDIRRIEKMLTRFGKRFESRIFTTGEQNYARRGKDDIKTLSSIYAKRFAAKEACYKALGVGRNSDISWKDIEIINNITGAPEIKLSGKALQILQERISSNIQVRIFISLSDEYPYAQGYVIIDSANI